MIHRGILVATLAALVGLVGCGTRESPQRDAKGGTAQEDNSPTTANVDAGRADEGGSSADGGDATASESESAGTGDEGAPGEARGSEEGGTDSNAGRPEAPSGIVTSIEPQCPKRLDAVTVTVKTFPFADISYATSFADGRSYNLYGIATAGPDGKWVFTFAVPADAALGDGHVLVAAVHPDHGGGNGVGPFRVTEQGEC